MDADLALADYTVTEKTIVIRMDGAASDEDVRHLEEKVRKVVAKHGKGFAVVVVKGVDRAKLLVDPLEYFLNPDLSQIVGKPKKYPNCS